MEDCPKMIVNGAFGRHKRPLVEGRSPRPSAGWIITCVCAPSKARAIAVLQLSAAVALLILASASPAWSADIRLGAPFGDHMVIQRDRPILVWGEAAKGASIEV